MSAEIITSGTTPQRGDTRRLLLVKMVNAAAGSGSGDVRQGNYAGGAPNFTPASGAGIAFDNSNGTVWNFFGGSWH